MHILRTAFLALIIILLFFKPSYSQQQDNYLAYAQVMPKPVGGMAAIYKNLTYPESAREAHLEGKVYLLVCVNSNGGIDDVSIIKGLGMGCDQAAEKAIKSVAFTPGENKGKNVNVKLAISVTFQLNN